VWVVFGLIRGFQVFPPNAKYTCQRSASAT
jgi:hypothetical protein